MLPQHSYEPEGWRARVGKFACRVAGAAVVLAATVGRWIVLAKNRVRPKYAPGLVVVSIDRLLDSDRERLAGLVGHRWGSPVVPSPQWMGVCGRWRRPLTPTFPSRKARTGSPT